MPDQAQSLRNHVAKHGKADAKPWPKLQTIEELSAHMEARSKLEWNARTLGFDMYEVSHMSTDTLQRIANLAEERFK